MDNYLLLQNKKRLFMLVRYPDRFHLITVNSKLDEKNEERVLSGACSDPAMDEMGLSFETIPTTDLRGVAIGGCFAGDQIVLYTKSSKRRFELSDDYIEEDMEAIFSGIERFLAPENKKSKSHKEDWRTQMQTQPMRNIMDSVGFALNLVGGISFFGITFFGRLSTMWSVACLSVMAVSLGLYFVYPQYFSIMESKEYKRLGYTAKVKHIGLSIAFPAMALVLRTLSDFAFPAWKPLLIAGAIAGIAAFAAVFILSREVRDHLSLTFTALFLSLFVSWAIVGQLNHLANFSAGAPQTYTVVHTERERNTKGQDRYYCTVVLEDGSELELPISAATHSQLLPGDAASVYTGLGALGIAYAYYVE